MTEQTEQKPTRPSAPEPRAGTERAASPRPADEAEEATVAESVVETGSSAPGTAVPRETEQDEPPKPVGGRTEQNHQPSAPASGREPAAELESDPVPVTATAPASASAATPVPVPEGGATIVSDPAPVTAPTPASASAPSPASEPQPAHVTETGASLATLAPTLAPVPDPAVIRNRRALRATLRWTAAVLIFAAFGAGTAYGIAGMERTDVPGLATEPDGRWDYPTLTKPPLPSGSPGPLAADNKAGSHYADLRALVLPAPKGATVDKALSGSDGWLPTKDFLTEYADKDDREELGHKLSENGLRHIAARGWTTPDGTHTRIYLLHFDTAAVVDDLFGRDIAPYGSPGYALRGAPDSVSDEHFPDAARIQDITASVYVESKPYGAEQVRHAYVSAGDILALVVQSREGTANPIPFQQTVTLQSQLLG
jgi:hypothetical protein